MGLISICPVRRFVDGLDMPNVQAATRKLLSAFFKAMRTNTVYLGSGVTPRIKTLAEAATGIPVLASGHGVESQTGLPVPSVLAVESAVEECSIRMTQLQELPNVSAGISFGLDEEANSPKNRWSLSLHRGPLPLLELCISDSTSFKPSGSWAKSVISSDGAHVVWASGKGYVGGADHLYLWLKRQQLFPYSKGDSGGKAVEAGQRLRRSCQQAWAKRSSDMPGLYQLSSWRWSQRRFVRKFDKLLLDSLGREELAKALKPMGTDLDHWLKAT